MYSIIVVPPPTAEELHSNQSRPGPGERLAFGRSAQGIDVTFPRKGVSRTAALKFLPTGTGTPRRLTHLLELIDREVESRCRLKQPRLIRMYETLVIDDQERPALDGATVLVPERGASQAPSATARPNSVRTRAFRRGTAD